MNPTFLPYNLSRQPDRKHVRLLVAPDARTGEYWYENLKYWLGDPASLYWFSDWETLPYDQYTPHPDLVAERLRVLAELPTRTHGIVIASAAALRQRLCPQTHLDKYGIHLALGDRLARDALIHRLIDAGYQHNPHISGKGEYAARGNIVDLYPMNAADPIRLEWFDDTIDSIRTFAVADQRTLEKLDRISILPRSELDLSDAGRTCYRQNARLHYGEKITNSPLYQQISDGQTPQGLEYYLPLFYDDTATLFDYLPKNSQVLTCDELPALLEQHANWCEQRYRRTNPLRENRLLPPDALWLTPAETLARLAALPAVPYKEYADAIPFSGDARAREQQWQAQIDQGGDLTLHFPSEGSREQWQERLGARGLALTHTVSPNRHSFRDGDAVHLAEADLHTTPVAPNYRQSRSRDPAALIRSLQDLSPGTAVVHADFGVGRYQGLEKLEADGDELIAITYAKGAKLYVPTADIDLITRYGGSDPDSAPLHELGGKSWQTARRKIRASLHDTAAELLALYAKREATAGITIAHDPAAQAALAAEFPFATTPDQQTAIDAVLADLARPQPMDRIICGDVGFGKTEVAVRAIHAAASAGYQVALIAPTTLLAEQHYHNLQDRFANHPLTIDSLSRFKSAADAKRAIERLKAGGTDLIIGTHRLLQKDIAFKNLGLVIIDEEQRFGVRHKEKLKSLRSDTNLLTLTATPIPRTLNLALSGLRDISIIATPPAGRQNIQTILAEWDIETIRDACEREHRRGGQTYILHNDIDSIERIARLLQDALPEQRIAIGHGQMRELEPLMRDFQNRHYDILIATTIIESGIDIPNANTIIINRADKFGLSQLHQLRGRVGRSHHQAYAYLITPNWNTLGKDAQRRLEAFTTLDSLGAGFLLARQDLEIRGAGEILGDEQSGQIQQIGISYYLDLLERSVAALKNGETADLDAPRSNIELGVPALLPDDYVYDPQERLVLYQRFAQSKSDADIQDLAAELIDRFGALPFAAQNLIARSRLRRRADKLAIEHISMSERETRVRFTDPARINPEPLLTRIQSDPGRYRANSNSAITINYPETETNSDGIALSGEERFTAHLAELEAILTEITP